MNQTTKIAKVYLPNNEIRKFSTQNKCFEDFKKTMSEGGIDLKGITLQYQDDESEWVVFSSETEWIQALSEKSSILRVRVVLPKNGQISRIVPVKRNLKCCSLSYAQYTHNLPADLFDFNQV